MKLRLERNEYGKDYTGGSLFINGLFFCSTIEDVVRPYGEKVKGETAIQCGTYEIVLDFSQRFQKVMPHILNVPNFEGIRIHSGNTAKDSEGCILVGVKSETKGFISDSRNTYKRLMDALEFIDRKHEPMTIEIVNA